MDYLEAIETFLALAKRNEARMKECQAQIAALERRLDDAEKVADRQIDMMADTILKQAATIDRLNVAVFLLTRELVARDRARAYFSTN